VSHTYDRRIDVETLARVEGEGAFHVRVTDGRVERAELEIYEPPRFFEGLLVGRHFTEPPDITARICGICPVAYQTSAFNAIESLCGVTVPAPIQDLRRLLYTGEWIESHILHIAMLHAPDFLGYDSVVEMAADHRDVVETALRLRKTGNAVLEVVGGRAVHPINVRLGGFHRAPDHHELEALRPDLEWCLQAAEDVARLVASFEFPELEIDTAFLTLRADRYPFENGRLVTSTGVDVDVDAWEDHVIEDHIEHSTALHASLADGTGYLTGPLARFALCHDELSADAQALAADLGLVAPERNPFRSIVVRAVELYEAVYEALRIIDRYEPPDEPYVEVEPVAGVGRGGSEAPRGTLFHRYEITDDGLIRSARIVPPTSQNQRAIESDLARLVETHLDLADADLTWRCEQSIRNYDPCISCSTHFLTLDLER
jgi:coenzyme F420-reducing hydrogenase alpha subunit